MRQVLFTIPLMGRNIPLYGYGVMLVLAMLSAVNLAAYLAKREKLDPENIHDVSLWALLGGLGGARLFYVWQYWGTRIKSLGDAFKIWEGGIVLYGGIIGGALAFSLFWARRRFPFRPMMDTTAPAIAIGIAIGRIGCFLNGCCWGDACDLPWAVQFPAQSPAWWAQVNRGMISATDPHSLALHPTQIYSAIDGFIICALLLAFYPIRKRDGQVFALLMLTYPISRFLIEYLRNDEGVFTYGMTISQFISIFIFTIGALLWAYVSYPKQPLYVDTADAPADEGSETPAPTPMA